MEDNKRKLYDALSDEFDLGTYEEFERNIGDSVKRQKLYDAASADYDLGDFESYSQKIGPTHRENLESFTAEHGSFLNDFEARDTAETKRMMASARSGAYMPSENAVSGEERQKYMELHKQEEALKKAWFTSDEYLAQKDADALFLSNISKNINKESMEFAQANPVLRQEGAFQINPYATRGTEADTELEKYRTASRIMDDAIKIHNAPSRYDGKNVFLKFGRGAGDILSDADFWTAGLTEIADNFGVRSVLKSVQDKLGNLNDLSEESIENILSPAEKAVLQAWAINAQEQLKRKDDLSRAYQAGQGATESLGFMAEFALTGGVGKLASEGVESMAKWLSKKAMTTVGGMADDVAEKVLRETGEKIAKSTVGKYGTRLAESLAEAAGRTGVMPSTFRNISEKATEINTDEEGNNYLVGMNNAFAKGFADSFIENLSEGGRVNALGELIGDVAGKIPAYRRMVDKFSNTKASELLDAFNSSGIMNTLRAGGWHGLGEEYLEEWYGNALRTLTGVDKEALKEFATVDNQIVTITSFLPMTIFGGTVGTAQVLSASRDLEKKSAALKSALLERGYDEAQADNMIDMMRGSTPAEVSEFLSPIVNSVAGRSVDEAAALMKPVGEFAAAVRRWQAFDTKYKYQEQEQRDNLRTQMEETLGQFWQEDENGRQTVQRGVNASGESVYLLGKPSAEEAEAGVSAEVAAITSDGRKVFVNPSDYELDDELEMNDFLGTEIMAEKGNKEQARMIEERETQNAAIREAAVPGTAINIGTEEAPVQAIVIQRNPDGVIVNTPDGQARQMTLEEFGNYVGINAVPMTDAQIEEQEADVLSAERAQREAALDQEYSNEESTYEEIAEAEDEIEQATEAAEALPLKADGSVDQTALWNNDPERWAQWNDEQRQDGGVNSLAYINGAIAKESARIAEMQAGYDAISDFDERDAVEREVVAVRKRLQRLVNLRDGYVARAEAAQVAAEEVVAETSSAPEETVDNQSNLTARMASEMTQQELNDLDEMYDTILSQTRVVSERARLLQEYLDKIAEGSTPIKVLTKQNYESVMRAAGCPEADIAQVGIVMQQLLPGQAIAGFASAGNIFVMADSIPDISEARITYVHERQHIFNAADPQFVAQMASVLKSRKLALEVLKKFVGEKGLLEYENRDLLGLADEIIARSMETAYTTEDFSVTLQSKGIPSEVISIITNIDNEQRQNQSLIAARRYSYAAVSGRENNTEEGGDSQQISSRILGQEGNRPSDLSERGVSPRSTGEGAEVISEEQLNAPNSGEPQQITAEDGEVIADTNGKGGVRFSIRTWLEGGRNYLAAWLDRDETLTEEEKTDILARMDEFYENAQKYTDTYVPFGKWSEAAVRYDSNGNPLMSVIKANGDYAMNLDFSLVCKKRRPLNRLLRTLINRNAFGTYSLKEREIAEINWILQEHGFEVACALCFVDSKRYRVSGVADVFAALYNKMVKALAPEGTPIAHFNYNNNPNVEVVENGIDTLADDQLNWDNFEKYASRFKPTSVEGKVAQFLRDNPSQRRLVDATDFIEAEGFEAVKANNQDLLKLYNAKKGTGGPKASFGDVQYLNDILKKEKSFDVDKAYSVGGVRIQSFSDFVPHMYFDYMQLFAELAAKKLPAHAYTKEVLFAKIFGLTGLKINLSLVPAVVDGGVAPGLDAEGNYAWADAVRDPEENVIQQAQSFPFEEAMAIQNAPGYSRNCGAIAVGISDEHIEKMLDDPNIQFIIPYHKSSLNAIVARMTNIDQYKDYTNVQTTKKASGTKLDKDTKDFNFNEHLHNLGENGTPQQAAQEYLDWCRENNFRPKFSQFAYHPNYYKLLVDFNTIDTTTGEYTPQGAVTMSFPTEQNAFGNVEALIEQGLGEDMQLEEKMEAEIDEIADKVEARLEEISKEPKLTEKQQLKKMAELADERAAQVKAKAGGVIDLVEEARKAQTKHDEKPSLRFRFAPRTDEQREQMFDAAKTEFGTAKKFKTAGYMLPDGSLLDFSEEENRGERTLDHRAIARVMNDRNYDSRYDYIVDFMNEGGIRVIPEFAGLQMTTKPSEQQEKKIWDFIYTYDGEIILQIDDENGGQQVYMEYDRRTPASKIFRDINGYFNDGVVPEQDVRFRTSNNNQTIFVSNAARAVEGIKQEKATKKNSGISGEGTAVVIKEFDDTRFRTTGTPTEDVVAEGVSLSPAQLASLAGDIFAALPEDVRKKITDGLNGNILGLQDAILQIPTSLATKENWNDEDRQMAEVVAEQMTKAVGKEMTRPFSASEALWTLYNAVNKSTDLVSEASRALVRRNLGFDSQTLEMEDGARDGVRFRTVGDASANAQASMYNRGAVNVRTRLKESFVDMHASVEELVKAIEKKSGKIAQGFENVLMALNQQSSKGLAAMEAYEQKFLNKMFDEIRAIMDKTDFRYEDIVRYVILKHGLERNIKLAQRDAKAHYQEIYDDIIAKINGMNPAQKRTYLTNAQLRDADAKAEIARLQAVNTSSLTPDQLRDHKKELAKAKKEASEAAEHLVRAQKIATMTEQDALDELDKIFKKIEKGTDSVYKEMRKNDYSGISSMFYDTLGVDRKNYATEEEYQSALMQAKADKYDTLGDIEGAAQMEVTLFENEVNTDNLWKSINNATKETLRQQYEANMISKDQYDNLRNMFEFYVPLRGFKDNTAEDMYTYYRRPNSTGYTKPILGAEGRKTEAESPFGWIAAMAGSAIASNVKNEAKLALYYFVANRPDNGVATLSRTWFVHTPGDVDANGKKIFRPAYPPFNEDLSTDAAKQAYEDWQEQMRDLQKQGLAYEAGQRLNLGNSVVNISDTNKPEHIVNVKVGGKDYTIVINGNPRAAQAINGDLNIESSAQDYGTVFGPMLRWMSSVNTSYNPEFWVTNMMRDMAFTMMAVNIKEDPAYRRKFKKNYAKAFKVISMVAKNEKGTLGNSYIENMYKDFVKYGGVTGYTQIKDSETWEKEIENYLKSNDPASIRNGKVMRGMKSAFHAAHRFGESLEQVSRFAAFLTAVETGKSINEAINDAKEITVNFNRKGSGKMITLEEAKYLTDKNGQPLNKLEQWAAVGFSSIAPLGRRFIMFFNAAIQGLNATYKLYAKNKIKAIGWALGYAAVGMMNAVLHAMLDDDDDYLDIPQYERRTSLMIGGNGAYFKWALPQEARAFYALGDLAVESVMGRNPQKWYQKGSTLGQAIMISTEILPINPVEGWKAFMPSVAVPVVELALNEDYKGSPIYNEQKWLSEEEKKRSTKWSKAYSGTGDMYIGIAKVLNAVTGGDEHDAGLINLQPEKMEHIVQSAFGGTIRTADKFINTITAAIDPEEDVTIRQTPFLNRFLTINDERYRNVHVNDVYDYYSAEAEHTIRLEKQYTKDRNADALKDLKSSDEYKWARIYSKYKKPIKKYQEKIRAAEGTAERMELMKQQDELKRKMIKEISDL